VALSQVSIVDCCHASYLGSRLGPARFAHFFADLVEIDARGLDAEEPSHDGPKYRGDNQTIKQETRANRSQQDGKQKRGCHRADLGKAAAKPAPAPRIAVGKTSPASR
jgi:hypothetical protein